MGLSTKTHINYVDKSFSTPLHLAIHGGNLEAIKLCIEQGAKIDQQQVCHLVMMTLRSFFCGYGNNHSNCTYKYIHVYGFQNRTQK